MPIIISVICHLKRFTENGSGLSGLLSQQWISCDMQVLCKCTLCLNGALCSFLDCLFWKIVYFNYVPFKECFPDATWYLSNSSDSQMFLWVNRQVLARCFCFYESWLTSQIIQSVGISESIDINQSISVNQFNPIEVSNFIREFFVFL